MQQPPPSILKPESSGFGHQTQTPPGDEPPPRLPPRKMSRPRIQLPALNIPKPILSAVPPTAGTAGTGNVHWGHHGHHGHYPVMAPMTPLTSGIMGGPTGVPIGMAGALGRFNVYPTKASEFMFKQFAGTC